MRISRAWVLVIFGFLAPFAVWGDEETKPAAAATPDTVPKAISALEAGGLQAALDALPKSGGTIFLPA